MIKTEIIVENTAHIRRFVFLKIQIKLYGYILHLLHQYDNSMNKNFTEMLRLRSATPNGQTKTNCCSVFSKIRMNLGVFHSTMQRAARTHATLSIEPA